MRSSTGALVPLDSVATLTPGLGPLTVNHLGQLPSVTISFNPKPGVSLSDAVADVQRVQRELRIPATLSATFQGTAQAFQASLKGQGLLLLVTILVIYLVLGVLYESFIHPLTILSGLPSAGVGALATLLLFRMELNVYGFVGMIMLVGIVKKNAIMMIDVALDRERAGETPAEAIYQGCLLRFRPIMMTTMAALLGHGPHRAGPRRRRRGPAAPGPRRRGRAPGLAAPDPLHHAGPLPLHGRGAEVPGRPSDLERLLLAPAAPADAGRRARASLLDPRVVGDGALGARGVSRSATGSPGRDERGGLGGPVRGPPCHSRRRAPTFSSSCTSTS